MNRRNNRIYLVATDAEYTMANATFDDATIIKTGVGVANVISKLSHYIGVLRMCDVINVGYAGSNKLHVGDVVRINQSYALEFPKNVQIDAPFQGIQLSTRSDKDVYPCYTSYDFVTQYDGKAPVVFDMELNHICAFDCYNLYAYKIITDNLSVKEYDQFDSHASWQKLKEMIERDFT